MNYVEKLSDYIKKDAEKKAFDFIRHTCKYKLECDNLLFWLVSASYCLEKGEVSLFFESMQHCVNIDSSYYEIYLLLGNYYLQFEKNVNQAYLCFEHAYMYCGEPDACEEIFQWMEDCKKAPDFYVRGYSFVILSYNHKEMMQELVQSICISCGKDDYEIVAIDSGSEDGIQEWLSEQENIILGVTETFKSFSNGCNVGVEKCKKTHDLFFLNNDTYIPEHAVFYLRLALYSSEHVGAVGPKTNRGSGDQRVFEFRDKTFEQMKERMKSENYLPKDGYPFYEDTLFLSGFALLVKRCAYDSTSGWDENFRFGNFEDNDMCMQLIQNQFRMCLVHNSFFFHYGSQSMAENKEKYDKSISENERRFYQKWGVIHNKYSRRSLIALIEEEREKRLYVLVVGDKMHSTVYSVKYYFPNSLVDGLYADGKMLSYLHDSSIELFEKFDFSRYQRGNYDYILFESMSKKLLFDRTKMEEIKALLKPDGKLIFGMNDVFTAEKLNAKDVICEELTKNAFRVLTFIPVGSVFVPKMYYDGLEQYLVCAERKM